MYHYSQDSDGTLVPSEFLAAASFDSYHKHFMKEVVW